MHKFLRPLTNLMRANGQLCISSCPASFEPLVKLLFSTSHVSSIASSSSSLLATSIAAPRQVQYFATYVNNETFVDRNHPFEDQLRWICRSKKKLNSSNFEKHDFKKLCIDRDKKIRAYLNMARHQATLNVDGHPNEFKLIHELIQKVHNFNYINQKQPHQKQSKTKNANHDKESYHTSGATCTTGTSSDTGTNTTAQEVQPMEKSFRQGYLIHYYQSNYGHHPCYKKDSVTNIKKRIPKMYFHLDFDELRGQIPAKWMRLLSSDINPPWSEASIEPIKLKDIKYVKQLDDIQFARNHGWDHGISIHMKDGSTYSFAARNQADAKSWCRSLETAKTNDVKTNTVTLNSFAKRYPYVIEFEWTLDSAKDQDKGRGDVVFTNGNGNFAVVEVKALSFTGNRSGRNSKRRFVRHQALRYAHLYKKAIQRVLNSKKVQIEPFFFTNDDLNHIYGLKHHTKKGGFNMPKPKI